MSPHYLTTTIFQFSFAFDLLHYRTNMKTEKNRNWGLGNFLESSCHIGDPYQEPGCVRYILGDLAAYGALGSAFPIGPMGPGDRQ